MLVNNEPEAARELDLISVSKHLVQIMLNSHKFKNQYALNNMISGFWRMSL